MEFYIVEKENGDVKIGTSINAERRIKAYGTINKKTIYKIPNDHDIANYLELKTMLFFNSDTENIKNRKYVDVIDESKNIIDDLSISNMYFLPLDIDLRVDQNGYIFMCDIFKFLNKYRQDKGKPKPQFKKYINSKETKLFIECIRDIGHNSQPLVSKKGYGHFAIFPIVSDYIMWCDASLKCKILRFMYESREYPKFNKYNKQIINPMV